MESNAREAKGSTIQSNRQLVLSVTRNSRLERDSTSNVTGEWRIIVVICIGHRLSLIRSVPECCVVVECRVRMRKASKRSPARLETAQSNLGLERRRRFYVLRFVELTLSVRIVLCAARTSDGASRRTRLYC